MKRAEFERLEARRLRWRNAILVVVGAVVVVGALLYLYFLEKGTVIDFGHRGKAVARNEVVNLVRAVRAFEMEYSRLPVPEGTTADVRTETDEAFMAILLGADPVPNPRGKVFYAGKVAAKDGTRGLLVVDPKLGPRLVDSWGRPFGLILDGDGDGSVTAPDGTRVAAPAISYSLGEDGILDAKDPQFW